MLNIGVFGAGHLGRTHLRILKASKKFNLVGYYDPDPNTKTNLDSDNYCKYYNSPEELIKLVDVVDIVTPTISHMDIAILAIKSKKHVFIEKPIASSDSEANKIVECANEYGVLGQVGHVERFNPAFKSVSKSIINPMFIETHRLSEFNPRGTDVSVVLDLMIHDIDIVLTVVKSPVKTIDATGVSVISKSPDICNARILFESGCVANLTASRISLKKMRKSRFFQKDAYISIDFLSKKVEVVKIKKTKQDSDDLSLTFENAEGVKNQIYFENPEIFESNAIQDELESFALSISKSELPKVTLEQGRNALLIANKIIHCINNNR
jgi:predicted dehydrogenase